jgi:site-specific recombinase XerD
MERRAAIGLDGRSPLFCTLRGQPIKTAYVRALLRRLARKAGIQKRVHAHGLRHAFAFELANEETPLHLIQATLGHKSLQTTQTYVNHLNPTAVIAAMRSREWSL